MTTVYKDVKKIIHDSTGESFAISEFHHSNMPTLINKSVVDKLVQSIETAIHERFEDENPADCGFEEYYKNHYLVKTLKEYEEILKEEGQ